MNWAVLKVKSDPDKGGKLQLQVKDCVENGEGVMQKSILTVQALSATLCGDLSFLCLIAEAGLYILCYDAFR